MTLSTIERDLLRRPVQTVQAVPIVQTPSLILPRVAGEETASGFNGAVERLERFEHLEA